MKVCHRGGRLSFKKVWKTLGIEVKYIKKKNQVYKIKIKVLLKSDTCKIICTCIAIVSDLDNVLELTKTRQSWGSTKIKIFPHKKRSK